MNPLKYIQAKHSLLYATLLILICYCVQNFFWGNHYYIGVALHYDGNTYGAYAKDFFQQLQSAKEFYHTHRILPSFVIYILAKFLNIPLNMRHSVDNFFYFFNNFLFLLIAILWHQICTIKKMNRNIYLLGFIAIFINMFYLYYIQLVPVMTDAFAFFLGFLILYAYLNKNKWLLIIATFFCSFSWPIATVIVAPLFIYTNKNSFSENLLTTQKKNFYLLLLPLIFLSCTIIYYLTSSLISYSTLYIQQWSHTTKAEYNIIKLPISISILIGYLALIIWKSKIFLRLHNLLNVNYKNLFIYLSITAISYALIFYLEIQSHYYGHETSVVTAKQFVAYIIFGAIAHPGFFIVSNLIYYGPIFLLILCFLDDFFKTANNESLGMLLLTMVSLFLAINPESRELIFSLPFLIYIFCATMNKFEITISKVIFFLCASLVIYHPLPTVFFYW